jgi:hypothetical protein
MAKSPSTSGVGRGSFRQAQAWLHTWCGLWVSWLLFAVFLTGTLAVFEEPITHWMTPSTMPRTPRRRRIRRLKPGATCPSAWPGAWPIWKNTIPTRRCGSCGRLMPREQGA